MDIKSLSLNIISETSKVIVGKNDKIKLVVMSILANGHVLIEDLPGYGKTTLVKTLSKVLGLEYGRIQFVPDLLPSDVTGMMIYNQKDNDFELRKGPVMTNILLADEINRAIPRTQSALLEAMEERQITIDSERIPLPSPFIVLATQNPVEMESTFNLPCAQLDRFLIKLSLGSLSHDEEVEMLFRNGNDVLSDIHSVTSDEEILSAQSQIENVRVCESIASYIVRISQASRNYPGVLLGVSPRGSKALFKSSKVYAAMEGRDFVTPDDVKAVAPFVLSHRITVSPELTYSGTTSDKVIQSILSSVNVGMDEKDIFQRS